jgi:hypothetical protein
MSITLHNHICCPDVDAGNVQGVRSDQQCLNNRRIAYTAMMDGFRQTHQCRFPSLQIQLCGTCSIALATRCDLGAGGKCLTSVVDSLSCFRCKGGAACGKRQARYQHVLVYRWSLQASIHGITPVLV